MNILAIDPGFSRMGVCVGNIERQLLTYDLIETASNWDFSKRLFYIYERLEKFVDYYDIKTIVYEEPGKLMGRNALLVPQSLGCINIIAGKNNISVVKYSPSHIKLIVTGRGDADKTLVEDRVVKHFDLDRADFAFKFGSGKDDVMDAISVGYTFYYHLDNPTQVQPLTLVKKKIKTKQKVK